LTVPPFPDSSLAEKINLLGGKMENGIIYARFSSQSQNEQSIEAQIRICSEFAENKGIKIVNVYSDKAKTGTNTDRPAFQKMVSDAQTGAFKYIIVKT